MEDEVGLGDRYEVEDVGWVEQIVYRLMEVRQTLK